MNRIGIIFAMYEELEAMLKLVKLNKVNKIYDLDFYECTINDKECILVESGVGKVNASRSTQVLIDNYSHTLIIWCIETISLTRAHTHARTIIFHFLLSLLSL